MLQRKLSAIIILVWCGIIGIKANGQSKLSRPKLVVGIMVDQMRWDFLYRYYDRYAENGGFKRLLTKGFSCENGFIPYAPTVTALGHTCVYTGSVPAIHGITGNAFYDRLRRRAVYCTEDNTVKTVGAPEGTNGQQSPRNMLVTTIGDELKIATNFQSKVIGIAIKDRGGILPAGHSANAAYWYDSRNGNWITSDYYMQDLPQWVKDFNDRKLADKYYEQGWNLMYPANTYINSTTDEKAYEGKPLGPVKGFPYNLKGFIGKNYGAVASTPHGNSMTIELAKAAIENEALGRDAITDLLAVSFSSPDYIGHSFGPNSIEIEDTYLRLDKELGEFFNYLDSKVGVGQYLVFLTADHGVANVPGYMKENKLPGGTMDEMIWVSELAPLLNNKFGTSKLIVSSYNYQIHLDHNLMDSMNINSSEVKEFIIKYLEKKEVISRAFDISKVGEQPIPKKMREMYANGFYPSRSGDVQFVIKPHYIDGGATGTTHGLWNPYDAHIPMVWYGWNVKPGKLYREVYMTDIAPTISAMLKIQMPGGSVGDLIPEIAGK